MNTENKQSNGPLCSRGATIGAGYTIKDAERDSLLPPQRIHWNIRRGSEEGPTMGYVRIDIHEAALTTARKEAREAAFKEAAKIVAELPVRVNRLGVKKGSDMNGWSSAINQAIGALLEATEEGGGDG